MACDYRVVVLVLGYTKLVLMNLVIITLEWKHMHNMLVEFKASEDRVPWPVLARSVGTIAFLLVDSCFCILLLVGSHKRHRPSLRAYLGCAIAGVIVTVLLIANSTTDYITTAIEGNPYIGHGILRNPNDPISMLWFGVVNVAIQICLLVFVGKVIKALNKDPKTQAHNMETV